MAKRSKGEYVNGKKIRHGGDLELSFTVPSGTYLVCDGVFVTLLREIDGFIFNGEDLTIFSHPAAGEGWSKSATFEKK